MSPLRKKLSSKAGLPPGTLVHIGDRKTDETVITVIDYNEDVFRKKRIGSVDECRGYLDSPTITWMNVDGLQDVEVIEKLGSQLGLHSLVQEDILNTHQRPKMEDHGDYILLVIKMLRLDADGMDIISEQLSLILTPNCVISFQEMTGDVFDIVRTRIQTSRGRIRRMGADYLAYALLDAVVDTYFTILESYGEKMDGVEDAILNDPRPANLQMVHELRRELIQLRKTVWPTREAVNNLMRSESGLVREGTEVFLRDVYDHTIRVMDTVETHRDTASNLTDLYMSSVSNRMNEVMKVLTIIATIFIPLTFIAGIYGMNFDPDSSPYNMPELNWYWGYVACLISMVAVAMGMVVYFRRKGWI